MNLNVNITMKDLQNIDVRHFVATRRYFLLAGVTAGIAVVLALFTFVYQLPKTFETYQDLGEQRQVLSDLQKKVANLQNVAYQREYQDASKVDLALPSQKPLLELLASTSQAAQQAQVSVSDIQTSPGSLATGSAQATNAATDASTGTVPPDSSGITKKIGGIDALQIGLTVSGTLPQINDFLQRMDKITPITDVTQIQLSVVGAPGNTTMFEAKLLLTTYYFTQSIQVTVDAPLPALLGSEEQFLQQLENFNFPDVNKSNVIEGGGLQDLFGVNKAGVLQQ